MTAGRSPGTGECMGWRGPCAVERVHGLPSIYDRVHGDRVAHVPFVNGAGMVFVTDIPHMTV
ncbi:MAG: hypothetical protein AB7G11_04875 [Phycisphaerales bacterium]